jgi:plastocyanin
MSRRSTRPIRLAITTGTLAAALALAGVASAADSEVAIASFAFSPATITVTAGDTVTWVNGDEVAHTATGSGWDSGVIAGGASGSVTFASAATFAYACAIHPAMLGTVVVKERPVPPHGDGFITAPPTFAEAATAPATSRPGNGALPAVLALAALAGLGLGLRRRARTGAPRDES